LLRRVAPVFKGVVAMHEVKTRFISIVSQQWKDEWDWCDNSQDRIVDRALAGDPPASVAADIAGGLNNQLLVVMQLIAAALSATKV
jgi:hypothetical protein